MPKYKVWMIVLIVLGDTVKINWLIYLSKKSCNRSYEDEEDYHSSNTKSLPFSQICPAFNTFHKSRQILSFTAFHGKVCNAVTLLT